MHYTSKYFWCCLLLFVANQCVERLGIHIPYVHAYLDDLLTAGIVLGFTLLIQQQVTYRNPNYVFNKAHSIVFVCWYALLFEVIFPSYDSRHYADWLDVFAYGIGAIGFHYLGNNPAPGLLFKKGLIKKIIK